MASSSSRPSTSGAERDPGAAFGGDGQHTAAAFNPFAHMARQAVAAAQQQQLTAPEGLDTSKWVCIYPCYLNKVFSVSDGRKVPQEVALEDPVMAPHIAEVCANQLKLPTVIERKRHPKDWREYGLGRVKVSLRNADGEWVDEGLRTRKQLFLRVAKLMKETPARFTVPTLKKTPANPANDATRAGAKPPAAKAGGVKSLPTRKGAR